MSSRARAAERARSAASSSGAAAGRDAGCASASSRTPRATRSSPRSSCVTSRPRPPRPDAEQRTGAARGAHRRSRPEKRALQDAAVVGRTFWADHARGDGRGRPGARCARSRSAGFVVEARGLARCPVSRSSRSPRPDPRVAYRSIPRARARRAHAAVARWLEALAGERRPSSSSCSPTTTRRRLRRGAGDAGAAREQVRGAAVSGADRRGQTRGSASLSTRRRGSPTARSPWPGPTSSGSQAIELKGAVHDAVRSDAAFAAYPEALELAQAPR